MGKIYIVTSGIYSDYRIRAVFSTKPKAEEYKAIYDKADELEEANIEEYDIDEPYDEEFYTEVTMSKTGEVLETKLADWEGFRQYRGNNLVYSVRGINPEKAIKVVNEKRAAILAIDAWGNTDRLKEIK
jgi:hypothetical protein